MFEQSTSKAIQLPVMARFLDARLQPWIGNLAFLRRSVRLHKALLFVAMLSGGLCGLLYLRIQQPKYVSTARIDVAGMCAHGIVADDARAPCKRCFNETNPFPLRWARAADKQAYAIGVTNFDLTSQVTNFMERWRR
jgi:hypothetical protein